MFDNLIFSDSNNNELVFKEEYLNSEYPNTLTEKKFKIDFFKSIISRYSLEQGYEATFDTDIFEAVILENNRNNKIEIGRDIFGNSIYEGKKNGMVFSMKRNRSGSLQYLSMKEQASLEKDVFGKWNYRDSSGNEFKFGSHAWEMLRKKYGTEEEIFIFLVGSFL